MATDQSNGIWFLALNKVYFSTCLSLPLIIKAIVKTPTIPPKKIPIRNAVIIYSPNIIYSFCTISKGTILFGI